MSRPAQTAPIPLCAASMVADGAAIAVPLPALGREQAILVFRRGGVLHGYWDRCPHMGVSLRWGAKILVSPDGLYLRCASHDALFRVADGVCTMGPCLDEALEPAPLRVADGMLFLDLPAAPGSLV